MDERTRFVIGLKDGESMAVLCREFGISRKTGYKIFERYQECGLEGLSDRTRRPTPPPNTVTSQRSSSSAADSRESRSKEPADCRAARLVKNVIAPSSAWQTPSAARDPFAWPQAPLKAWGYGLPEDLSNRKGDPGETSFCDLPPSIRLQ